MKILVCGGRKFTDALAIHRHLDNLAREHGYLTIIEGDARGVDRIAGAWADARGHDHFTLRARWRDTKRPGAVVKLHANGEPYDAMAGPERNRRMLAERPDLVLAFPGGKGTRDMKEAADEAGIAVKEVS